VAEGQDSEVPGSGRSLYPALAVAALAGVALTYFFLARRAKSENTELPIEKVVSLCSSAADKLEAFAAQFAS